MTQEPAVTTPLLTVGATGDGLCGPDGCLLPTTTTTTTATGTVPVPTDTMTKDEE